LGVLGEDVLESVVQSNVSQDRELELVRERVLPSRFLIGLLFHRTVFVVVIVENIVESRPVGRVEDALGAERVDDGLEIRLCAHLELAERVSHERGPARFDVVTVRSADELQLILSLGGVVLRVARGRREKGCQKRRAAADLDEHVWEQTHFRHGGHPAGWRPVCGTSLARRFMVVRAARRPGRQVWINESICVPQV
jgi:hypothetical protein